MYHYVRAVARPHRRDSKWIEVDISKVSPYDIYNRFFNAYIELSNPFIAQNVTLNMDDVRDIALNENRSFEDWLVTLGNSALPTTDIFPTIQTGVVRYSDAVAAGYKVDTVDVSAHPTVELPRSDKEDLLLTKDGIDYETFYKNCLVSVNGMIHRTNQTVNGIQIVDGNLSSMHANLNTCGIMSFQEMGGIEIVDVDSDMLYKTDAEQTYHSRAYLDLDTDLNDKTVLLVLGGYLHVLDDSYGVIGEKSIMIDFDRIGLAHRYIQSREFIDMSSFGIEEKEGESTTFAVKDVRSESTVKALIDLTQTFVVLLEDTHVSKVKVLLEQTNLAKRYVSHQTPDLPLFGWLNKIYEYVPVQEANAWSIKTTDNRRMRLKIDTFAWKEENAVDDTALPYNPFNFEDAFFWKIIGQNLSFK